MDLARQKALFPLNTRRWLRTDVVKHAIHSFDAVENLVGCIAKNAVGQFDPIGGHGVFADDSTEADGLLVATFVAFNSDRFDREKRGVGLPSLLVPATAAEFADEDSISLLSDGDALGRDLAGDAYC